MCLYRATRSFLYQLQGTGAQNADQFSVHLSTGVTATTVFSTANHVDAWTHAWVDLTPWAGQTITPALAARATGPLSYVHLDLDEVSRGSWLTPVPRTIDPNQVEANVSTPVTITGENFLAGASVRLETIPLPAAHWVNSTTLTATVLGTIAPGRYDPWVTNPGGQAGVLPSGLTVGKQLVLPLVLKGFR